jgi:hypothetical protein
MYLIKTDSLGDTLWTKTYDLSSACDVGFSILETLDGGYIIAGCVNWDWGNIEDAFLMKTDFLGDTLWIQTYGTDSTFDCASSVIQTSDSGFVFAGRTGIFGYDTWLVKTDRNGNTLWTQTYGGHLSLGAYSVDIEQTSDGGYILIGENSLSDDGQVYLVKTDSLGDSLWSWTYGELGGYEDFGTSVQQTSDGGYIIVGSKDTSPLACFFSGDIYVIKTDSLGDTLWTRTFDSSWSDNGYSIQQTSDGGYVLTGHFGGSASLFKLDSLGNTQWIRDYYGVLGATGASVQQTFDRGYVIAGVTFFAGDSGYVYLVKTDENGLVVGIEEEPGSFELLNAEFRLNQNLPNPFHHSTLIQYQLFIIPSMSHSFLGGEKVGLHCVQLAVYDVTGRLVETLVDGPQEPGVYQVNWDGRNQSSGIYFYRLQVDDNFNKTRKMILLK